MAIKLVYINTAVVIKQMECSTKKFREEREVIKEKLLKKFSKLTNLFKGKRVEEKKGCRYKYWYCITITRINRGAYCGHFKEK